MRILAKFWGVLTIERPLRRDVEPVATIEGESSSARPSLRLVSPSPKVLPERRTLEQLLRDERQIVEGLRALLLEVDRIGEERRALMRRHDEIRAELAEHFTHHQARA